MDIAERLRRVTRNAQNEDDLPDYLAERLLAIADQLPAGQSEIPAIETLIEQVKQYDTYGQTGYLGMGVNHIILEKSLAQAEEELGVKPQGAL